MSNMIKFLMTVFIVTLITSPAAADDPAKGEYEPRPMFQKDGKTHTAFKNLMGSPGKGSKSNFKLEDYEKAAKASITMAGTETGSEITGTFKLIETAEGLILHGDIMNVPEPGEHGFHIHENGSCDDAGKAAGGHYNPRGVDHGSLEKDGTEAAHLGDLGNITIKDNGQGTLNLVLPNIKLSGDSDLNVAGKAVILHAKADDFGQPTGNAGGRIACGIITLTQ